MKLIPTIYHERLHRFVFDKYYVQNYHIHGFDKIILRFYHWLCEVNYNWRYTLRLQCRKYHRYSDYDRNYQQKPK